ncbi:type II CAAX prenyl endopeptidase Rce1 family protein [Desulfobulbus sp.]|uniref:CPBP family glutamic-type intramembrane protease n=1 Tax=Desulfobulbus sp. TaxID=895 RepID=UPI00286ED053|nr:CPBP family glutamic-type intramembrane protease [Desulfobulbus sp.]
MITNRQLLLPYALPYLAYVGIASIPDEILAPHANYLCRLIIVPLLLAWAWRWYCPLTGPKPVWGSIATGAVAGLAGLLLWLALLAPFVQPDEASPWTVPSFLLRLLSAGLVVPLFEELMMRGFAFRLALQWDQARQAGQANPLHVALDRRCIDEVPPGSWSWMAIALSTLAFTAGHTMPEWPAAVAYGLLMAWLLIRRQDLIACITAHAITNIFLALFVYATDSWHFW